MLIHFLQQIQPPVLPVLQELSDEPTKKNSMFKKCSKWNVYLYEDLQKLVRENSRLHEEKFCLVRLERSMDEEESIINRCIMD